MITECRIRTGGINHVALVCRDMKQTVDFYTGSRDAAVQDGRTAPAARRHGSTAAAGRQGAWWRRMRPRPRRHRLSEGHAVDAQRHAVCGRRTTCLASMNEAELEAALERLEEAGVEHTHMVFNHDDSPSGYARQMHEGVFVRSVYFTDPNGIMLEFAATTRAFGPEDARHAPASGSRHRAGASLMPRLREVPRTEAEDKTVLPLYAALFGDRDPVAEPGTATGTRGDWWSVVRKLARHAKARRAGFCLLPFARAQA